MSLPVLRVAVVGHTNTGKTSLLRTLTRDAEFGEVFDRPATTRHVEGAALVVEGTPLVALYDTPGLEDSLGLAEHLDGMDRDRGAPWVAVIQRFLDSAAAKDRFEQEAKALRQVFAAHVALYVIDARDRLLAKHREELEILARCARPVVPVLNFVADPAADTAAWRDYLRTINLHAVAAFDTVVVDPESERRLFEAMRVLLDGFDETMDAVIADRARLRHRLITSAARLLADLLIDAAAHRELVDGESPDRDSAVNTLRDQVRAREQRCVADLLALFHFGTEELDAADLPLADGQWGLDLFSPDSLREFGIRAGGGAAAGAAAGLTIDALTGGLTLGAAAALGAAAGALWGSFGSHGRRLLDQARGFSELRVDDATLRLLAVRQLTLIEALLRRGHASQQRIAVAEGAAVPRQDWTTGALPDSLQRARAHPDWSAFESAAAGHMDSSGRRSARDDLTETLAEALKAPLNAALPPD
ncbi:MAG: GTPase/DUF3482 domain-containing protein [Magnetospiraceae bacterium]